MSEWWTYRLTSFLLFSPRTYYRTIELYNLATWPAHLAGLAIGIAIVVLLSMRRASGDRIIAALLAICWLWIGWAFHYERYAQINWVAPWIGLAFALEAALLVGFGVVGAPRVAWAEARPVLVKPGGARHSWRQRGSTCRFWFALSLVAIVIAGYPLLARLAGRSWTSAEVFGVAPDPTAIATVAVLSLAHGRIRWLLLVIPLLWCASTALTLRAMRAPEFYVVIVAALLALLPSLTSFGSARGTP